MDQLQSAILQLQELESDEALPRNIRQKLHAATTILLTQTEPNIKISKALAELESLTNDCTVEAQTRTQLFSILSLLEAL